MLEVNLDAIEKYVDTFLNNLLFSEIPSKQKSELKDFLTDYLVKLYREYPEDVVALIQQSETLNPFMLKMALGYGIEEEDVYDITKILFMKIVEFFYKKGSLEALKGLKKIFDYYGLEGHIYKIIFKRDDESYYLEDIETKELIKIEDEEFEKKITTPGHLLKKSDYMTYSFIDRYDTIVIYIKFVLAVKIDEKMQQPVDLLLAYSLSLHRYDLLCMQFTTSVFNNVELDDYLYFLQFLYLKYLKVKYGDDLGLKTGYIKAWITYINDEDDMDQAKTLLEGLLADEYSSRSGIEYFLRVGSHILNKNKHKITNLTFEDIRTKAYQRNEQIAMIIDNFNDERDFYLNIKLIINCINQYLDTLPQSTDLERAVKNTLRYVFMFYIFIILADFIKNIKSLVYRFKRYYLPVYTQFIFDEYNIFRIRNDYFRIYVEDDIRILLMMHLSDLFYIRDEQTVVVIQHENSRTYAFDYIRVTKNPSTETTT